MSRTDRQTATDHLTNADTVPISREQTPVTITLATTPHRRRLPVARAIALAAGVSAMSGLGLVVAGPAGASTLDGTATITSPGTTTEINSGGSATQFTVTLPAQAACDGDTATDGYHVYSYLLPQGTPLSGVSFAGGSPTKGLGLFEAVGTYYGPVNTAIGTGQIVGIPNDFEWAPMIADAYLPLTGAGGLLYSGSGATASGIWEAGLTCANTDGVPVDNWNTEVMFTASSSDPNGFVWSAVPGAPTTTTTTTTTTTASSTTTTTSATSTTDPGSATSTTTSTNPDSSTSTTSTTAAAATSGDDNGTGSSVDAASTSPTGSSGTTGGTLAFTGIRATRDIGIGLLGVGLGLMLLGWGYRRRIRAGRQAGQ